MGHPWGQAPTNPWAIAQLASPVFLLFLSLSLYFANFREVPGVSGDAREVPGFPGNSGNLKKNGAPKARARGQPWGQASRSSWGSFGASLGPGTDKLPGQLPSPFFVVSLFISAFLRISGKIREVSGDTRGFPGSSENFWECPGIPGKIPGIFREFRNTTFGDPGHPSSQKPNEGTCFLSTQGTRGARTPMKTKDFFGSPWAPEELEHL